MLGVPLNQDLTLVPRRVQDIRLHALGWHALLVQEKRVVLRVEQGLAYHDRVRVIGHFLGLLVVNGRACSVSKLWLVLLAEHGF